MAPQQIQWGSITLHLDNEAFRRGFLAARAWYFADIHGEDGRQPEEPPHAVELTAEEVLRLVVMPDEQGRYHFDEMGYEHLPEDLGYLVGYLGGPLAPDEATHYRKAQAQQEYLRSSVPASDTEGRECLPSRSQRVFNEHQSVYISHLCEQIYNRKTALGA